MVLSPLDWADGRLMFPVKRIAWLRKRHLQPLRKRALAVLGDGGDLLIDKLLLTTRCGERQARFILRAAARIPDDEAGMRRRILYVENCIDRPKREQQKIMEDEALSLELGAEGADHDPQPLLGDRLVTALGMKGWEYFTETLWTLIVRSNVDHRQDQQLSRLTALYETALTKRSPRRYLQAVIRNERADIRYRSRKRKQARAKAASARKTKPEKGAQ